MTATPRRAWITHIGSAIGGAGLLWIAIQALHSGGFVSAPASAVALNDSCRAIRGTIELHCVKQDGQFERLFERLDTLTAQNARQWRYIRGGAR